MLELNLEVHLGAHGGAEHRERAWWQGKNLGGWCQPVIPSKVKLRLDCAKL